MRSFTLIGLIGVLLASTSIAQAHNTRWAWTESKAAKMVARDATVKLAVGERASLTAELNDAVRLYGAPRLRRAAGGRQGGDGDVPVRPGPVSSRARDQVRSGLGIDAAACKGSGTAAAGQPVQALPLRRYVRGCSRFPQTDARLRRSASCRR